MYKQLANILIWIVTQNSVYRKTERVTVTSYSRYNLCMFLLSSSIIMGMCFELFSVSYLVPASVCELHTTSTQQGLIACVPLAGIILTSTIWGYLGDTRGRKKTLIISMTMGFIAGSFAAFSPHWIVLSVLKLISSASMAGAFALCITILGECTPMAKRSGLVILCTSVFLLISGLMAVIAIPILPLKFSFYIPILGIQFNSWRVLGLIYSFPSAVSALGVSFAYESPKFLLTVGKHKEAIQVLRGIYTMNTGKSADTFEVDEVFLDEGSSTSVAKGFFRSLIAQAVCLLKPPLMKHTILVSSLFVISYICINSFIIWLPYIVNVLMTSVTAGNRHLTICQMIRGYQNSTIIEENTDCSMNTFAMTMVFGIQSVLSVVNVMMSGLASCVGRKTIFIGIQLICGTAALAINSSPYWILSSVLIMVFISGIFNFGFLSTYSVDIFPTYVRATAVCLTLMLGRGSSMAGINILKQLMDHNCEYIFYIAGSLSIFGGLVGFLLPSDEQIFGKKTVTKV